MTDVLYSFIFVMVFFIDQLYRTHGCIQYRKQNSAMFSTFTKGLPYLPNGFWKTLSGYYILRFLLRAATLWNTSKVTDANQVISMPPESSTL